MSQMNEVKLLAEIGFTELEARVYLYFLRHGASKVTDAYKSLGMDKSSTYRIVDNLVDRKLLVGLGEEYGKQYMVSDTQLLNELVEEKQDQLKVVSNEISSMLKQFTEDIAEQYKKHNVTVLEGEEAFFTIMEKRLEIKKGPIREIDNTLLLRQAKGAYDDYIPGYIERRKKKGLLLKTIRPYKDHVRRDVKIIPGSLKEVRVLPKEIVPEAFLTTFGDYTAVHNLKGSRLLGIIIKTRLSLEW